MKIKEKTEVKPIHKILQILNFAKPFKNVDHLQIS
jgi:hypothetical protein